MFLLMAVAGKAQFYHGYSQFMFNGLTLNPAYAGSRELLSTAFVNRTQWVGHEGAPKYRTLSVDAPLSNNKMGLGFLFFNESMAISKTTDVYLNYAYRIHLKNSFISFGLKAGLNTFKYGWDEIETIDPGDEAFAGETDRQYLPNFGLGVFYNTKKFFLGVSVPKLLSKPEGSGNEGSLTSDFNNYNYFITSGYVFTPYENFALKPSVLVRYLPSTSLTVDLNANAIIYNRVWLGAIYRVNAAIAVITQVQVNDQIRIGYSYDFSVSELSTYNKGSHEILLIYELSYKVNAYHPRYF